MFFVSGTHRIRQSAGQSESGVAELVRHTVFAHRNFDLHAGVVNLAKDFLDPAHGLAKKCGRLGQLDHHNLAGLGGADGPLGNEHVLPVALVFRRYQPDAAFLQQPANDGV